MMQIMAISFWQKLWLLIDSWDTVLFLEINTQWTSSFLDNIFPWWRDANTWIPLYLFIMFFLFLNFKNKAWVWILFALITVVITDQTSSHLIKTFIQRPRPCADDYLQFHVRLLLDHCSGGFSFASSHATNHFGFAVFVFITLKDVLKNWKWLFIFWAATISYAQVYVGVHYPLDVLCGGIMGALIGWLTATIYSKTQSVRIDTK
jgi:undecaprenyl-diphosphatase